MPDTTTSEPRPPSPIRLIAEAITTAAASGHIVMTEAPLGVVCDSTAAPRWIHDPRAAAISPLGALLLALQPPIPLADEALAHILGTSMVYVLGLDDGIAGDTPSGAIAKGPAARLYADGYTTGTELRALLQRRQGVPLERPAAEITDRIPALADAQDEAKRREAAARLLTALPVSAALELVAEVARTKMEAATDGRIREELEFVSQAAAELAGGARDQGL